MMCSLPAYSAVDYTACENNNWDLKDRVSPEGKIIPRVGEVIKSRKELENGDVEVIFNQDDPRYRDIEEKITFRTDDSGRIIGTKNVFDTSGFSKQNLNQIKKREAYKLAHGYYPGMCAQFSSGTGSPERGGAWLTTMKGDCSTSALFLQGRNQYIDPETLNKKRFEELKTGITWDQFKQMRDQDRKTKKERESIAKAYMKLMDKNGWSFYTGSESKFEIKDDKCILKSNVDLMKNGKTGAIMEMETYNADQCHKIEEVVKRHEKSQNECRLSDSNFQTDYYKNVYGMDYYLPAPSISVDHRGTLKGRMGASSPYPQIQDKIDNCMIVKDLSSSRKQPLRQGTSGSATKQ